MDKGPNNKRLRARCIRRAQPAAFSLAELVVAVGILMLMLALAGQVFDLTIQSTGQATAITEVNQLLRAFEQTIREDLRHVEPGRSLILIQGNPVNAYWTQEGMEADDDGDPSNGYPHRSDPTREDDTGNLEPPRADVLMFFTARKAASAVHPGVTSNVQQVVYGHAELGEYVPGATPGGPLYEFEPGPEAFPVDPANDYPSPTLPSPIPAERWHLARRGVLLMSTAPPPDADPQWAEAAPNAAGQPVGEWEATPTPPTRRIGALGNGWLLRGETDVLANFRFEEWVLTPGLDPPLGPPWYLPAVFAPALNDPPGEALPYARSRLDLTPPPLYADRLGAFFLPDCASFKVEWAIDRRNAFVAGRLAGLKELFWFDPGRFDPGGYDPENPRHPLAELEKERNATETAFRDATDPAQQAKFQLRYVRLDALLDGPALHNDGGTYSLSDRFLPPALQSDRIPGWDPDERAWLALAPDGRANLVVFGAARLNAFTDETVPEDIFPSALRITVDVFDSQRRLERPVRHVMVIPVGG